MTYKKIHLRPKQTPPETPAAQNAPQQKPVQAECCALQNTSCGKLQHAFESTRVAHIYASLRAKCCAGATAQHLKRALPSTSRFVVSLAFVLKYDSEKLTRYHEYWILDLWISWHTYPNVRYAGNIYQGITYDVMLQPQGAWMLVLNRHARGCDYRSSNIYSDSEYAMAVGWTKRCYENTWYDGWYDKKCQRPHFVQPFTGHDPTRRSGQGQVRRFQNVTGRVGSDGVGWGCSGQEGFKISRPDPTREVWPGP